jgi:hypothetical protein
MPPGGLLKFAPLGDATVTDGYVTYTPNNSAVGDLGYDDEGVANVVRRRHRRVDLAVHVDQCLVFPLDRIGVIEAGAIADLELQGIGPVGRVDDRARDRRLALLGDEIEPENPAVGQIGPALQDL